MPFLNRYFGSTYQIHMPAPTVANCDPRQIATPRLLGTRQERPLPEEDGACFEPSAAERIAGASEPNSRGAMPWR